MNVDWQRCALNIRQEGYPLAAVDRKIKEWPGFTAKVANGSIKEPKFSQGLALLDLHFDICGHEKTTELAK